MYYQSSSKLTRHGLTLPVCRVRDGEPQLGDVVTMRIGRDYENGGYLFADLIVGKYRGDWCLLDGDDLRFWIDVVDSGPDIKDILGE